MFCRGIKGEFDFLREEFQKTVLVCPSLHCSMYLIFFDTQGSEDIFPCWTCC